MKTEKYVVVYKEVANPNLDLSDDTNIRLMRVEFDTLCDAQNFAESIRQNAGQWDAKIIILDGGKEESH